LTEPRYRLNVTSGGRGVLRLVAFGVADGTSFRLLDDPFWYLCGAERSRASVPLRTKKRSAAVIEACFASLDCESRTELNRLIRAALSTGDFDKRSVRTEAKRIITDFADWCDSSVQLVMAGERGWCLVSQEVRRQARLLEVPYRVFGPDIFSESGEVGEMALDRDVLLAHLPELRARLAELPKDKPIVAYCRGPFCLMSDEAVKLLGKRGFRATKLADGVSEWLAAGLPLEAGER
jgi:non-specific serine/threonine protein kinase